MFDGIIDPDSAAGIAGAASEKSLTTLALVTDQAKIASDAATDIAAKQVAITALLSAVGVAHKWTGTSVQLLLPDGTYGLSVDLKGVQGNPGPTPILHTGTVTSGSAPGYTIHSDDPANPIVDVVLPVGTNGWSPVTASIVDGARRVQRVVDWQGGTGAKPTTGLYVGATGLVPLLADAVDQRGAPGSLTASGTPTAGHIATWASGASLQDGGALTAFGQSLIAAASAPAVKTLLSIAAGDVSGLGTAALLNSGSSTGNVPVLDSSGKLLASILPALAITDSFVVGSQAAMLALTAERGDVAIRTDLSKSFILQADNPSVLANWQELLTPLAAVSSVATLTGAITAAALKSALAIAVADITDASANGRSLISAANYAAMRILLAISLADITDASASGRSFVAAANYAAMRTLLGLGGAALLNVGTTSGTVAAGDDPRIAGFPVTSVSSISTAATIAASNKGTLYDLTGSFTQALPAVSGASASGPLFYHFRKRDGSGVVTVTCAGSDTIEGGATSFAIYQERVTIVSFGGPWYFPPGGRQTGKIKIETIAVGTSASAVPVSTGFSDPLLAEHDVRFYGLTKAATAYMCARVSKGGTLQATNYNVSAEMGITSAAATSPDANNSRQQIKFETAPSTTPGSGSVRLANATSTTVTDHVLRYEGDGGALGGVVAARAWNTNCRRHRCDCLGGLDVNDRRNRRELHRRDRHPHGRPPLASSPLPRWPDSATNEPAGGEPVLTA